MKKSQLVSIISIAAFILNLNSSVSAQSLYTQSGSDDPTWNYIMDNNLIPVGSNSTDGITGSTIDVNQDHSLISSSPYKNRVIQEETAIHTLGNSTVQRSSFHKWSRWYQEDGNTQVFRLFKDEINVRNDVWYKPRIEAELKDHVTGSTIKNGADWVEWSGTYTVLDPVKCTIFQIWGSGSSAIPLMLHMENDGRIRYNPRQGGSGWKTMVQDATNKSFHIRVRDYGNKYEVYLNGALFESRNYNRGSGGGHFRWGLYHSGEAVAKDFMMFVTGAQMRYSNDPDDTSAIGPDGYSYSVDESETVVFSDVPYDVAYGQDGQYEYLLEQTEDVPCTNGTFGNDPVPGVQKYCFTRESKVPYLGYPTPIPGIIEAENYDYGGAARSYMDDDSENNGDVNFREDQGVDIGVGAENVGHAIGWTQDNEWLEYTIQVSQTGMYDFDFLVASANNTGVLGINIDGTTLLTGVQIPQTGGWDEYSSITETAQLTAGEHVLRINIESGGFNIDNIKINNETLSINDFAKETLSIYPNPSLTGVFSLSSKIPFKVYSISGKLLIENNSDQIDLSKFSNGIYILRSGNKIVKLIK
ncbi:carbohydrate-binding protein [uncultured Aquimarina sp.]|uniref:carbohydrate-binding protein n=1 Tax=uncultured Aquimarina sp. TaxID=575652 RepID=UPI0026114C3F|nr:carbohydrate-binding protein [uncultured Aquimarina sp.]